VGTFRPAWAGPCAVPGLRALTLDRPLPTVDVGLVSRRGDASESHRTLADRIRQVGGAGPPG
jgi:hypothetical protein